MTPSVPPDAMLLQSLLFFLGLTLLYFGAEGLVRGASSLALRYGIRPLIVGLTVVAMGTSMPELVVNVIAAFSGEDSLALGNVIGSNISNIGLILGLSAVVSPIVVAQSTLRREYVLLVGVSVVFLVLCLDGTISRVDGGLLMAGLAGFFYFLLREARKQPMPIAARAVATLEEVVHEEEEEEKAGKQLPIMKKSWQAFYLAGGIVLLAGGAHLMVEAAVFFAERMGISSIVIGLTVVAIGTSLPELAASVVGAMRGQADLCFGNVLGSNLLNVLFVIGFISLFRPLAVADEALRLHFPVMLGFSLVLFPIVRSGFRISRMEGVLLMVSFVVYVLYLVLPHL